MNNNNEISLLEMKQVTKQFPGVLALNHVDLELKRGEVLALLGENGAGKSTLIKILSGAYQQDEGEILIEGELQHYTTPKEANEKGVSIIYQEMNYLNDLTVAENIFLNRYPLKGRRIDWKQLHRKANEILNTLSVDIGTNRYMRDLSVAEKQLVEIAKALSQNMKILVMDEPTAALSEKETEKLLGLVRDLRDKGTGIIFISHRLDELFLIADRVLVMRDGERIDVVPIKDANREDLIHMMVGRKLESFYPKHEITFGDTILETFSVTTDYLKDVSFKVRAGEILGIFGLMGAGRTELARCLFGIQKMSEGKIEIDGKPVDIHRPADAIAHGIGFVTAERKKDGLILIQSVSNNIMTASLDRYSKPFKIDRKAEKEVSANWKDKLNIKTPSVNTLVETLSGGNQQKVVLAKWLATHPRILILNEPTRGIDVGAKTEIYRLMEGFCEQGLGVIMISSDLPEVLQISDRVIVMFEGRLTAEYLHADMSQDKLMKGAVGEN
ncbi:ribose import ATP-binding protein RbsA 2 [Clostridia bacterium]|nr:ribose import ATP-binding protein RbsA 2 [Clostridia bacterium]